MFELDCLRHAPCAGERYSPDLRAERRTSRGSLPMSRESNRSILALAAEDPILGGWPGGRLVPSTTERGTFARLLAPR